MKESPPSPPGELTSEEQAKPPVVPDPEKNPNAYQYYVDHFLPPKGEGEFKMVDGQKYEKVATRWTIRSYYNHPGPGWGYLGSLEDLGYSRFKLHELPDTPFYDYQSVKSK